MIDWGHGCGRGGDNDGVSNGEGDGCCALL